MFKTQVRRALSERTNEYRVRITDAGQLLAEHNRHYGKSEQIDAAEHIEALRQAKQAAIGHHKQHQLYQHVPGNEPFLSHSTGHGYPLALSGSENPPSGLMR